MHEFICSFRLSGGFIVTPLYVSPSNSTQPLRCLALISQSSAPPLAMVATDEPYKGTTRRYLRTIEHDSLQHSLAAQKMLIKGDLVGIHAVSYNFFRDSVLPVVNKFHVPDFNLVLNSVYATCVESKLIVNKRFAFFTDGPAVIKQKSKLADERETESTIFANMQSLWRKVAEQAATIITKLNPTVIYTQTPNANALMERPEGFKPDAISLLAKSMMPEGYGNTLRYYLCNAAVLEEERITDTPANREEVCKFIYLF